MDKMFSVFMTHMMLENFNVKKSFQLYSSANLLGPVIYGTLTENNFCEYVYRSLTVLHHQSSF